MLERLTVTQTNIKRLTLPLELPDFFRDALKLPLKTVHHVVDFRENRVRPLKLLVERGDVSRAAHVVAKTLVLQLGKLLFKLA